MSPAPTWPQLATRLAAARRKRLISPDAAVQSGMSLRDLRRFRQVSQVTLAHRLKVTQPGVSKLEGQGDLHVRTLQRYVMALGGRLELLARFPGGDVVLLPFSEA